MSCSAETQSRMKSKLPPLLFHLRRIFRQDNFICPQAFGVVGFAGRSREKNRVRSQRMGELHPHVTQSAQADDSDFLARRHFPVPHR